VRNHIRALLFDSSDGSGEALITEVFSTWDAAEAVCLIPLSLPEALRDQAIVRCDPTTVIDLTTGISSDRNQAIVQTPDLAAVVLTSGTTGQPRPVELSFHAMESSARAVYDVTGLKEKDAWLCCLPPHYIAGLAIFARCYVTGSKLIYHSTFDVARVAEAIKTQKISAISLVSNQLEKLIDADVNLSPLKTILLGGSSVTDSLREKYESLSLNVHRTYGMTETFGGVCHDGHMLANSRVRIIDDEIEIQSGSMMSGYRHDLPATAARVTPDGWFHTHDRGAIVDGMLKVFGRIDDVINSSGVKVDPLFVENALRSLGINAVVIGTDHSTLGECVTVTVESETELDDISILRNKLREHLPSTHLPIRTARVTKYPRTDSGKIKRKNIDDITIVQEHTL
jgi:O-succinylbenzoic acid--CoA ligase